MYTLSRSNYLRQVQLANSKRAKLFKVEHPISHRKRVMRDLKSLGLSRVGLGSMEGHYLPHVIHPDEQIGGVVYGHHKNGFAMLVATDCRIIFLDKKPLFVNEDEINYYVVSGVSFSHAGFGSTITLHTRIKDIQLQTLNRKSAEGFVEYIESRSLEHTKDSAEKYYDQLK
jgi:hypothetical protein